MSRALSLLAELRADLREPLTDEAADGLWNKVLWIESDLEHGDDYQNQDAPLMRRLREKVSDVLAARNAGAPTLPVSLASIAAAALESHLQRGTFGADGWPLRS